MGDSKWRTVSDSKLSAEIDKLAAEIDALSGGATRTKDANLAIKLARLSATHDALVLVYNSLS